MLCATLIGCLVVGGRAVVAQPKPSDTKLVIATSTPFDTLDPHSILDARRTIVRLELYDALFRWLDTPVRIAPWLAQSYTVSEDGRTFRFSLRKGARFHDGAEVKATDVVYSIERILASKRGVAPLLATLLSPGSTKAIDATTVEFSLSRPSPLFLTLLPEISIVNSELLKSNELNNDWGRGWLQQNDAGSGAYQLKTYFPGAGFVAERYAAHWNTDWSVRPIEQLEVRSMLDSEGGIEALIAGEVHVLHGSFLPHQLRRLKEIKDLSVIERDVPRVFLGVLHSGREQMKLQPFRRAIAQAFNTASLFNHVLGPGTAPVAVPLPPSIAAAPPGISQPQFDLAAAGEAIAKLKLPSRELTIGAIAGDPHSEGAALIMLDGLVKLGIPARIVSEPWPVVSGRMRDEKQMYDILFFWRSARYLDANNWLGELYDCELVGAGNMSWYCNRDVDRLIKEARATADPQARKQANEKAAALLAEDQAGIFLATSRLVSAHSKRVKGLHFTPVGDAVDPRMATVD